MFDIPVVLLMFKREKVVDIIRRVEQVQPSKIYLISDGGRTLEEHEEVRKCRRLAENAITWPCEVVKNYSEINRGVYENIAGGAKWVFERESKAIFLEDDNLPETSFFFFCKEMLDRYENDSRILWVCGTNYLEEYLPKESVSYVFTRHMLPCGWASWSEKFCKYYDGELHGCDDQRILRNIGYQYITKALYKQYKTCWLSEYNRRKQGKRFASWDMQMDFTIKSNSLLGICPCANQIKNIGVDDASIHGGTSLNAVMTRRFCGMDSKPIRFPLVHPNTVLVDEVFEKKIGRIMLYPIHVRIKTGVSRVLRRVFSIPDGTSTKQFFRIFFQWRGLGK